MKPTCALAQDRDERVHRAERVSATITTMVSSVVGSCHETIVPAPDAAGGRSAATPRPRVQLAAGERAAVVVAEHGVVGPLVGRLFDQGHTVAGYGGIPSTRRRPYASPYPGLPLSTSRRRRERHGEDQPRADRRPPVRRPVRRGSAPRGGGAPSRSTWCAPPRRATRTGWRWWNAAARSPLPSSTPRSTVPSSRSGRRAPMPATRCSCSQATTSPRRSRSTRCCASARW